MREKYLAYLSELVERKINGLTVKKPRVRHPKKWHDLKTESKNGLFKNIQELLKTDKKIWIWSDLHFYHENVIGFSDRPFANSKEMNTCLIANYNKVVSDGDIVIFAGDITFKGVTNFKKDILPFFSKSYNILVVGNHDFSGKKIKNLEFDETHLILDFNYNNNKIVISHYPFETESNDFLNIHGHIHHHNSEFKHQRNVSIEAIDYKPVLLKDILRTS